MLVLICRPMMFSFVEWGPAPPSLAEPLCPVSGARRADRRESPTGSYRRRGHFLEQISPHAATGVEPKLHPRHPTDAKAPADRENSAEQLEDRLRGLVGLSQHRDAGLLQDLVAAELRHFLGHVGIANAALRRGQVLRGHTEVLDGVLEAVLDRTEARAVRGDAIDRTVQRGDRSVRACLLYTSRCV